MSQAHKGSKLILRDQVIAVPFESSHFDFSFDATGICRGELVEPTSDSIYTVRPYEGRFGGGVSIEERTTNIISSSNANTLSGWIKANHTDTGKRISDSNGNDSIVWNIADEGYAHIDAPMTSGNTYTFSIYVFPNQDYTFSVRVGAPENDTSGYIELITAKANRWTRLVNTKSVQSSRLLIGYRGFDSASNPPDNFEVAYSMAQLEEKPFSTSFANGSRGGGVLKYNDNIINHLEGAVSFWYKPSIAWDSKVNNTAPNETDREYFFEWGVAGQANSFWARRYRDSNPSLNFIYNNGNTIYRYDGKLSGNQEILITYTYKDNYQALYVDGKKIATNSTPSIKRPTSGVFSIGKRLENYSTSNGIISDFIIFNRFIDDEEVEAIYISNNSLYNPYDYRSFSI